MAARRIRAFLFLTPALLITVIIGSLTMEVQSQEDAEHLTYLPVITLRPEWEVKCIECDHTVITDLPPRSAALDSNGQPHIVYGGEHLYYAYLTRNGVWEKEIVDMSPSVNTHATLALDAADHPHVIYRGSENFRYAYHDGAEWHIEDLPTSIDPYTPYDSVGFVSLDIDSANRPHISYIEYNPSGDPDLMYAFREGSDWQIFPLIGLPSPRNQSYLVVDSTDRPHIATVGSKGIIYARFDGSNWLIEKIASESWSISLSLDLDSNDYPHIAAETGVLEYIYKDESGWHSEIVNDEFGSFGQTFEKPSLTLDDDDQPHIAYYAFECGWPYGCAPVLPPSKLNYAYRSQDGWFSEHIGLGSSESSSYGNIVAANHSDVHIFSKYEDNFIHRRKNDGGWSETIIDRSRVFGLQISLVMDFNGKPIVNYFESESFRYYLAVPITETWSIRPLESPTINGYDCLRDCKSSLAIGPDNALQMVYRSNYRWRFQPDPAVYHFAIRDSSDFDDLVTACPSRDCYGLIAVDSQSRSHVVASGDYFIGQFDDASSGYLWIRDEIDALDRVDALAVDMADRPIIAGPGSSAGVIYAVKTDDSWITETVSSQYWLKNMALDPDGMPHFIVGSEWLKAESYLYFDGTAWQEETIDIRGSDVCDPGIVIDSDYGVHAAYLTGDGIIYAYRDISGWNSRLEIEGGSACSLALDSAGRPYIAYTDPVDLKIIYRKY